MRILIEGSEIVSFFWRFWNVDFVWITFDFEGILRLFSRNLERKNYRYSYFQGVPKICRLNQSIKNSLAYYQQSLLLRSIFEVIMRQVAWKILHRFLHRYRLVTLRGYFQYHLRMTVEQISKFRTHFFSIRTFQLVMRKSGLPIRQNCNHK